MINYCVYFIQEGLDGPVKIGFTDNIDRRFAHLQSSNSRILKLRFAIPFDSEEEARDTERVFHKKAYPYWIRAEWFKSGVIDYASLLIRERFSDKTLIRAITGNSIHTFNNYDAKQVHDYSIKHRIHGRNLKPFRPNKKNQTLDLSIGNDG